MKTKHISTVNEAPLDAAGRYVLYWMQQSQRAHFNPPRPNTAKRYGRPVNPCAFNAGTCAGGLVIPPISYAARSLPRSTERRRV